MTDSNQNTHHHAASKTVSLVFDDNCGYCRRQVQRLRRMDRADRFDYVPRSAPDLTQRFPQLAGADFNQGMRLVDAEGRVFVGADAVHGVLQRLPGWRRLAWLYRVPGLHALSRAVYRWIAANRHRLPGCDDKIACPRPPVKNDHSS
jgi:predicted DCC family thiol-disulfide oxidoreductase YuxK